MNIKKCNLFKHKLKNYVKKLDNSFSNIIFLCIGTDKIIGDSVGPIVGSKLKSIENEYIKIYGTVGNNLDFLNTKKVVEEIYAKFENPFIITIDAALSKERETGEICISDGYIKVGNALDKSICFYSNINIKCVVGKYYKLDKKMNINTLKDVDKEEIYNMTEIVSNGIKSILEKINIYV